MGDKKQAQANDICLDPVGREVSCNMSEPDQLVCDQGSMGNSAVADKIDPIPAAATPVTISFGCATAGISMYLIGTL